MRIKLLNSPAIYTKGPEARRILLPHGMGILTSFLRKNSVFVDAKDLDAELRSPLSRLKQINTLNRFMKYCSLQFSSGYYTGISDKRNDSFAGDMLDLACVQNYDLVGLGVYSELQILTALLLAEKIKKEYNIPVVIGGPYVTEFAHLFFEKYGFIDYAVSGEGEVPLLELIRHISGEIPKESVPSLWHKDNKRAVFNGRAFFNIEDQSCPDFEGLSLGLYAGYMKNGKKELVLPYSTTRGCSGRCAFCTYPKDDGPWQSKSVKKIVNDIIFLKGKYKSSFFDFRDSNFNVSYQHVNDLCDELIKEKVNIQWNALVKGSNLDKELIVKMRKSGCYRLAWGVESGSSGLLKLMKKDLDIRRCAELLETAKGVGINNLTYFMVGYPYENPLDLEQTSLFLKNNARFIDDIVISIFRVNYGSFVYTNHEDLKIDIKETKSSSFSYGYKYEYREADEYGKRSMAIRNIKSINKVIGYSFRYIKHKEARFPFNLAVKYLGPIFPREFFMIEKHPRVKIFS